MENIHCVWKFVENTNSMIRLPRGWDNRQSENGYKISVFNITKDIKLKLEKSNQKKFELRIAKFEKESTQCSAIKIFPLDGKPSENE